MRTPLRRIPEEKAVRYAFLTQEVLRVLPLPDERRATQVLDVGCGHGDVVTKLALAGYHPVGMDIRKTLLPGSPVVRASAFALPFRNQTFDASLMLSFLEHIPKQSWARVLPEVKRVLRAGARVVIQIPNPRFPIELHSRIPLYGYVPRRMRRFAYRTLYGNEPDFELITPRDVKEACEREGLIPETDKGYTLPLEALPARVRRIGHLFRRIPMGYLMVFRTPGRTST